VLTIGVLILLLSSAIVAAWALRVPTVGPSTPGPTASTGTTTPGAASRSILGNVTVGAGAPLATTPSTFWSIDAQTKCASCIDSNASVKAFLNATPFTWFRYGEGTDECNASIDTQYSSGGAASTGCAFNVTALKSWCASRSSACHAILTLPGENNNSAEDAAIAKWIVSTAGFQPDYWSIGNEPTGWTHYGIPWTQWKSSDSAVATPLAYAFDVKAAITAVLAVDPTARFIGLEAACSCNTAWFQDVAQIDGDRLSAIAYHSYPSSGSSTPTPAEFYQPLASSSNLTASYASVRADVTGLCTNCSSLPIFVNEYNAGPGAGASDLGGTYENAVFLAASVAQALRANVSQLTLFNLQTDSTSSYGFSMMNGNGNVGPTGDLFSQLLSHVAVGVVLPGGVAGTIPGLWSSITQSTTEESLLAVNTNLTDSLQLSTNGSPFAGASGVAYQWSSSQAAPNSTSGSIAGSYTVPSQGILLLTVVRGPGPLADLPWRDYRFPSASSATSAVIHLGSPPETSVQIAPATSGTGAIARPITVSRMGSYVGSG
jgi:hypothetical protein